MEEIHDSLGTEQQPGAGGPGPITTVTALITALGQAGSGVTIPLLGQEYQLEDPLFIPNGVTLKGVGEMQVVNGLPVGFLGTTTRITAKSNFAGNLLTLGNGSKVQKLRLEGASQAGGGNVVAVASRGPNDILSATIEECELVNQIESGGVPDGPVGGAILAYTRNPPNPAPPAPPDPPHEGATVTVTVTQSIVETKKAGKAVFAMNFASGSKVTVKLKNNVVRGPLDVIGGLSRPDAVVFATTTIDSERNLYSPLPSGGDAEAWQIIGGSDPPVSAGPNSSSDSNTARVESRDDQIVGFKVGILAVGGRRGSPGGRGCSHNEVKLDLLNMTLDTKRHQGSAADFVFVGADSDGPFSAGDGNIVHARIQETHGSGLRDNLYADSQGFGTGNKLIFVGTGDSFDSNEDIKPAPTAEFFEHGG